MHIKYPTTAIDLILEQKRKFEDIKGVIRSRNWKDRQLNGQKKEQKDKQRCTKTLQRKLKIEQHELHLKPGVNLGAP
jgi:hypothetical protein